MRLRNTATNQVRVVRTNAQGFYRASLLQIGPYEITVESPSFAPSRQSGIALSTGEILTLNAWEGLEPAQIAVALAISPATARTRLHRARGRLRAALSQAATTPPSASFAAPSEVSPMTTKEQM